MRHRSRLYLCKFKLGLTSPVWKSQLIGFLGKMQLNPITAPVGLQIKNKCNNAHLCQINFNLLGRDAICKLGIQIWCPPDGV